MPAIAGVPRTGSVQRFLEPAKENFNYDMPEQLQAVGISK
jgi:hypothetical protein